MFANAKKPIVFTGGLVLGLVLGTAFVAPAQTPAPQIARTALPAVVAQPSKDPDHLGLGKPERNEKLLSRKGFVTLHDNTRKVPLWAAYRLTPDNLKNPRPRLPSTAFRADPDLPPGERAELFDYRKSGFDRGHMVPSGDMRRTDEVQQESFYLSNIAPQNGFLNQHPWKALEDQTRDWVKESEEAYIYVGVVPGATLKTIGKNRVVIPEAFFKVVALKQKGTWHAIGFVVDNDKDAGEADEWIMRISDIELLTGFRFFSSLQPQDQDRLRNNLPKSLTDWK